MTRADSGQAAVLAVGVVALGAAALVATAHLGRSANDAARAQTAADAAALAGLHGFASGAASLAAANGGAVVSFSRRVGPVGPDVIVTVRVGRASASARATSGS